MSVIELTTENFQETIDDGIAIVDFWATWCGPCRAFAPVFEAAAKKHQDIKFGKIDTESQRELASGFMIQAIPTLMVFRDNILVFRQSGALPPPAFERLIKSVRELDMDEVRAEIAKQQAEEEAEAAAEPGSQGEDQPESGETEGEDESEMTVPGPESSESTRPTVDPDDEDF